MTTLILSDFDGTMTGKSGKWVVNSPFYQSLQLDSERGYAESVFKPAFELENLFSQYFQSSCEADKSLLLISPSNLAMVKKLLSNLAINFIIVTKNRSEYIQALLKYQGFTTYEITQLLVLSTVETGLSKSALVHKYLSFQEKHCFNRIYLLDDSKEDYSSMHRVLSQRGLIDKLVGYANPSGQFDWPHIFQGTIDE